MNKIQQKIYLNIKNNKKIKQLAEINRRPISAEIEIAIEEHIEKYEAKFGEIPDDLRYKSQGGGNTDKN